MTQGTGGGEGRWPFERVNEAPGTTGIPGPAGAGFAARTPDDASPARERPAAHRPADGAGAGTGGAGARAGGAGTRTRRRPPVWLLVLLALVVVGGAVALVLLLPGDAEEPVVPPAETITLPPPTPTIDPVERPAGTPFAEALPATVLQFALTEQVEHEPLMAAGALEGYRLTYSDGGSVTLTLLAGQWRDAAGAAAQLEAVFATLGEIPEASDVAEPADEADEAGMDPGGTPTGPAEPADEPLPSPEQGPVTVDGQDVGRYVFVPREDGSGTLWWTNSTVLLQLDGPWSELRDVFTAFPL